MLCAFISSPDLAEKLEAAAHTCRLIEKFTSIPTTQLIDNIDTSGFSYLLVAGVPGRPIGQMLHAMADKQVAQAVTDLRDASLSVGA